MLEDQPPAEDLPCSSECFDAPIRIFRPAPERG
jgi:hypothetical protein